jgi:hypothetical protein
MFAGHTQSLGYDGTKGPIWNVNPNSGIYTLGQAIRNTGLAVTLFPEDPGNDETFYNVRDGDGVVGRGNPYVQNQRLNAPGEPNVADHALVTGNRRPTGALSFLIDGILNHNVRSIALIGYSHGAGSISVLTEALEDRAWVDDEIGQQLRLALVDLFDPLQLSFVTYIDGVAIDHNAGNPTGTFSPEDSYPVIDTRTGVGLIAPEYLLNIYQDSGFQVGPLEFFARDGVPVHGEELDEEEGEDLGLIVGETLIQINTDADPRWPQGLDHFQHPRILLGIAEDETVRRIVFDAMVSLFFEL